MEDMRQAFHMCCRLRITPPDPLTETAVNIQPANSKLLLMLRRVQVPRVKWKREISDLLLTLLKVHEQ